tara:strand:- start:229 stop:993 length:765 start_codon:yes stop_codon:yes gene_type:complete
MRKKQLKLTFKGILTLGLLYAFAIIFPQFLFANKLEYKNFIVYYHSSEKNNIEQLKAILEKSYLLLRKSELYDNKHKQKIFICNSYFEFGFFAPTVKKAFAVHYPIIQNAFFTKSSFQDNRIIRNGKNLNKRTLSSVIAHETIHSLIENRLGFLDYKRLPVWKNEGYCEFIAVKNNESYYDNQKGLNEICNNKEPNTPFFKYFKYRIFTEFLLNSKKISIDIFFKEDFDLKELKKNYKNQNCTQQRITKIASLE